jgi:hypothetical protein
MIKIIHQTWKTDQIPARDFPHAWQESWKKCNPEWEYRLWTDDDNERLVRDHYPKFLDDFTTLERGVVKADVARALYLHMFGGLYADLDYICLKPFGGMIDAFSSWFPEGISGRVLLADQVSHSGDWSRRLTNALMYADRPGNEALIRLVSDGLRDWAAGEYREGHNVEAICGPQRIGWMIHEGADGGSFHAWPGDLVCPKCELHDYHDIQTFAKWCDLDYVANMLPGSYAVTPRRGCWWPSPWNQSRVLNQIKGC